MNAATILSTLQEYHRLGIPQQIDYKKFYLYSIITHSTAIEGSTVTEIENQLLFDEGITAAGRTLSEQMMNLDLKAAYECGLRLAQQHAPYSVELLCRLSSIVMKNTGSIYNTPLGRFSAAKGELRKLNVTAGFGGRSYLAFQKVPPALHSFCRWLNAARTAFPPNDIIALYRLSFEAHYRLVSIHPWADGNGRMSRLVMNMLQFEQNLTPVKVLKEQRAEYIDALNRTHNLADINIFSDMMLRLHNTNLQNEIAAYKTSLEAKETAHISANVTQNVAQNVTQKSGDNIFQTKNRVLPPRQQQILQMMQADTAISASSMATQLGVSVRTIRRDIEALRKHYTIRWLGSSKCGHWQIE